MHSAVSGQTGDVEGATAVDGSEADLGGNRGMRGVGHWQEVWSQWCAVGISGA